MSFFQPQATGGVSPWKLVRCRYPSVNQHGNGKSQLVIQLQIVGFPLSCQFSFGGVGAFLPVCIHVASSIVGLKTL